MNQQLIYNEEIKSFDLHKKINYCIANLALQKFSTAKNLIKII